MPRNAASQPNHSVNQIGAGSAVAPKKWLLTLLLLGSAVLSSAASPRWRVEVESLGMQRFDRDPAALWMKQQGVVFLSDDRLLIYQVGRTAEQAKLAPRGSTGGSGNFLLNIKILDVQTGRVVKALELVTNAGISDVLATRRGGFLVRAGNSLTLYSSTFEQVASREINIEKKAPVEGWQVRVSPSGARVVLMHEQVDSNAEVLADGSILHDGQAKVDVEVLDSGTLQPQKTLTLAHTLSFWSPGEDFLVSSNPAHSYNDHQVGLLDFDGKWTPIHANFQLSKSPCGYAANALDHGLIVLYGCETFTALSTTGKRVLSQNDGRFIFASTEGSGHYLALECDHYRMGVSAPHHSADLSSRADRIQVYNLATRTRMLSVSVHSDTIQYALSGLGDLAVVDGPAVEIVPSKP